MAHKPHNQSSTMACTVQTTFQQPSNARWFLLGIGQSAIRHHRYSHKFFVFSNLIGIYSVSFCILLLSFVTSVFADVPDKPMLLPAFVENAHCLPYHLTRRGRSLADRVVCVLGFSCPDITFSPTLYPIAALLLHFMSGNIYFQLIFIENRCHEK